ncbi:MAG TPA: hypothetical protein DDW52_18370 [Planctomycetaceae bacterium]|nr:hypothetical protein [Planctomycetaceae bacterium]
MFMLCWRTTLELSLPFRASIVINSRETTNESSATSAPPHKTSGVWVVVAYVMPLVIAGTSLNASGWYGTGWSGTLQGYLRVAAFIIGMACAYFTLFRGAMHLKLAVLPAVLGYTGLLVGILFDHYI